MLPRILWLAATVPALLAGGPAVAAEPETHYALRCGGCHLPQGVSPPLGRIPPLKNVVGHFARLPEARRYIVNVPGIATAQLGDNETAALLNWVIDTYAGTSLPDDFRPFTAEEVAALRRRPPDDIIRLRAKVRELLTRQGYEIAAYP